MPIGWPSKAISIPVNKIYSIQIERIGSYTVWERTIKIVQILHIKKKKSFLIACDKREENEEKYQKIRIFHWNKLLHVVSICKIYQFLGCHDHRAHFKFGSDRTIMHPNSTVCNLRKSAHLHTYCHGLNRAVIYVIIMYWSHPNRDQLLRESRGTKNIRMCIWRRPHTHWSQFFKNGY